MSARPASPAAHVAVRANSRMRASDRVYVAGVLLRSMTAKERAEALAIAEQEPHGMLEKVAAHAARKDASKRSAKAVAA